MFGLVVLEQNWFADVQKEMSLKSPYYSEG